MKRIGVCVAICVVLALGALVSPAASQESNSGWDGMATTASVPAQRGSSSVFARTHNFNEWANPVILQLDRGTNGLTFRLV
jgi:hypothetical protein